MARPPFAAFAVAVAAIVAASAPPARAQEGPFSAASPVVGDQALDRLRGGYVDRSGIFASFGIERTTLLNGQVVVSQSVRIADLSRVSAAELSALRSLIGAPAVIQNTQSNQTIRNSVVLEATTNTLGILQRSGAARTMTDALIAPLVRP